MILSGIVSESQSKLALRTRYEIIVPVHEPIATLGDARRKPGRKTEALAPQRIIRIRRRACDERATDLSKATELLYSGDSLTTR